MVRRRMLEAITGNCPAKQPTRIGECLAGGFGSPARDDLVNHRNYVSATDIADRLLTPAGNELASWAIPPNRMKSDAPHIVPLALPALEILRALPQSKSYVIGGANPIHYSCAKAELDARMTALNGGKPIPRWTWHDLRRTFRTGLSDLKIAPHIAELAIAHGKQGLNRIYDQHRYDTELHEAFALWAQRVMSIVAPPPETVVPLRKAT